MAVAFALSAGSAHALRAQPLGDDDTLAAERRRMPWPAVEKGTALWDGALLRADKGRSRSSAEWCAVFDVPRGIGILALP